MKYFIALFGIVVFIFLSIYITLAVAVKKTALQNHEGFADAIVVLGARAFIDKHYNPCLLSRMEHAVNLYKAKQARKIIVSGGTDKEDKVNEAKTMKKIAIDLGVSAKDILIEPKSTSTYENLLFSQKLLTKSSLKTVIIVTEPFHSLRASLVAKKLGFSFISSPAVNSLCWQKGRFYSQFFLKEPLAIIIYKLQNKL